MSLAATRWAWDSQTEGHTKLVLLALAEHADEGGLCWPSVGRIAAKCGLSERTVQRSLTELMRDGLVTRTGRNGTVRFYQLGLHDPRQSVTPTPDNLTGDPRQPDGGPPTNRRGTPVRLTPEPTTEPLKEPPKEPLSRAGKPRERKMTRSERDFETWWQAYPRKVGKDAARRAYLRAISRGALPLALLAAIGAQTWNEDPRYRPHASTWLNGGRWQDDPGAAAPPEGPPPPRRGPRTPEQERRDAYGTDLLEEDEDE